MADHLVSYWPQVSFILPEKICSFVSDKNEVDIYRIIVHEELSDQVFCKFTELLF